MLTGGWKLSVLGRLPLAAEKRRTNRARDDSVVWRGLTNVRRVVAVEVAPRFDTGGASLYRSVAGFYEIAKTICERATFCCALQSACSGMAFTRALQSRSEGAHTRALMPEKRLSTRSR